MAIAESMLPEFDMEMASTRKCIERAPDAAFGYQPHAKSPTMQWLVSHLVEIPSWLKATLEADEFDFNPPGGQMYETPQQPDTATALAAFDEAVATAREALADTTDQTMMGNWSLLNSGQVLMTMPRVAVVRGFVLNHLIHHRAQLGIYLRLNDVPVPSIYGPSADEPGM